MIVLEDSFHVEWKFVIIYLMKITSGLAFLFLYQYIYVGESSTALFDIMNKASFFCIFFVVILFIMMPIYAYKRLKFHFGSDVINSLRKGEYQQLYIFKTTKEKLEKYIYMLRSISKFRRMFKKASALEDENLAEKKLKQIIELYKMEVEHREQDQKRTVKRRNTSTRMITVGKDSTARNKNMETLEQLVDDNFNKISEVSASKEERTFIVENTRNNDKVMTTDFDFRNEDMLMIEERLGRRDKFKSNFKDVVNDEIIFTSNMEYDQEKVEEEVKTRNWKVVEKEQTEKVEKFEEKIEDWIED